MSETRKKVLMGALMAAAGAVAAFVLDNVAQLEIPPAYLPFVTAAMSAAINWMRKAGWFGGGSVTPGPVVPTPSPTPSPLDDRPILKFLLEIVKDRFAAGDYEGAESAMDLSRRITAGKS